MKNKILLKWTMFFIALLWTTSATMAQTKITFKADFGLIPVSKVKLTVNAAPEDQANVWLDANGNGVKDSGEAITQFSTNPDEEVLYYITSTNFALYGKVTYLWCNEGTVTSLDASQNPYLKSLYCVDNKLKNLDVSNNQALVHLWCFRNNLKNLNLSNNPNLEELKCFENKLASLDVSNTPNLEELKCHKNKFQSLDVTHNSNLKILACSKNKLTSLDVSNNPNLEELWCYENKLASLDVSNNSNLKVLNCGSNKLQSLNVTNNVNLKDLKCGYNQLTSLSVSNNKDLKILECHKNPLGSLDVSQNSNLEKLWCESNYLGSLDVSQNSNLEKLRCESNYLGSLDVTHNPKLVGLDCSHNQIKTLDLSYNTELEVVFCKNNKLYSLNLANGNNHNMYIMNSEGNQEGLCLKIDEGFDPPECFKIGPFLGLFDSFNQYAGGWCWGEDAYIGTGTYCGYITIPDPNFKAALVANPAINTNGDGEIQTYEAETFTGTISCSNSNIKDLTGIEYFTAATELRCFNNQLKNIDLSHNTSLQKVFCGINQLKSLDVSELENLTYLNCQENQLHFLDVSQNHNLNKLLCYDNELQSINVANGNNNNMSVMWAQGNSGFFFSPCIQHDIGFDPTSNSNWKKDSNASWSVDCGEPIVYIPDPNFKAYLLNRSDINTNGDTEIWVKEAKAFAGMINCPNKNISRLKGIEAFTNLGMLNCQGNQLTSLDVSQNKALIKLYCQNNQIDLLDVSQNKDLEDLKCDNNGLNQLSIGQNNKLSILQCSKNNLEDIDVSKCHNLTQFDCSENGLTHLNINSNTHLEGLLCFDNELESFDASKYENLTKLWCNGNKLTHLDMSQNLHLEELNCKDNQLTYLNLRNGNNYNTNTMWAQGNPDLTCIEHDMLFNPDSKPCSYIKGWCKDNTTDWNGTQYSCTSPPADAPYIALDVVAGNAVLLKMKAEEQVDVWIETELGKYVYTKVGNSWSSPEDYISVEDTLTIYGNITGFNCEDNESNITALDASHNNYLKTLKCSGNQITTLNVSDNWRLKQLYCYDNQLSSLDLSDNDNLELLHCYNNQLSSLNLSGNDDLKWLNCSNNQLTTLDLNENEKLSSLMCNDNQLSTLNLHKNTDLGLLDCHNNQLTKLYFKNNLNLWYIICYNNPLTTHELDKMYCSLPDRNGTWNGLLYPLNTPSDSNFGEFAATNKQNAIDKNWKVSYLDYDEDSGHFGSLNNTDIPASTGDYDCDNPPVNTDNYITLTVKNGEEIHLRIIGDEDDTPVKIVSGNLEYNITVNNGNLLSGEYHNYLSGATTMTIYGDIKAFDCSLNGEKITALSSHNQYLEKLLCVGNQLTTLDVTQNENLEELWCSYNQLTTLDVTQNEKLWWLWCSNNQLTTLDVTQNEKLWWLWCSNNQLTTLDVTQNEKLRWLWCSNNQLTTLDINEKLRVLNCNHNQLTSLDISQNENLSRLICHNNLFTTAEWDRIYCDLPDRTDEYKGVIYPLNTPSDADYHTVIAANKGNAIRKNWRVHYYDYDVNTGPLYDTDIPETTGMDVCMGNTLVNPFVTLWNTTNLSSNIGSLTPSNDHEIYFPGIGSNYTIVWEEVSDPTHNGTVSNVTSTKGNPVKIDFGTPGEYLVKVLPEGFERLQFGEWTNTFIEYAYGDQNKLTEVKHWGDIEWTSMEKAFFKCRNMQVTAIDTPDLSQVTNMKGMFFKCRSMNADLNNWEVQNVENMKSLFFSCESFNQPLDSWEVSQATDMSRMFINCYSFNQDLGSWKLNNVSDLTYMLRASGMDCTTYGNTLIGWASNTNIATGITFGAQGLSYDINAQSAHDNLENLKGWTIEDNGMDIHCGSRFITQWDTENPSTAIDLLNVSNNQEIYFPGIGNHYTIEWVEVGYPQHSGTLTDVTSTSATPVKINFGKPGKYLVKVLPDGFEGIQFGKFTGILTDDEVYGDQKKITHITQWGAQTWTSMKEAFYNCENMTITATDQPDLSSVTDMTKMFYHCKSLNQSLNDWDVSNITNMYGMFKGCETFNQPLDKWQVSQVQHMSDMFYDCVAFNQPLNAWNVENVTYMRSMFTNCVLFDQPLNQWNVSKVKDMSGMFENCTSFNQNLGSWRLNAIQHNGLPMPFAPKSLQNMLNNCGMDCANYGYTLIGWAKSGPPNNLVLGATGLVYGNFALEAHNVLENTHNWIINGDSYEFGCGNPFITLWNTENTSSNIGALPPSSNQKIYFPGIGNNYTIEWEEVGDPTHNGTLTNITSTAGNPVEIDFDHPGEYIVKVLPQGFEAICFGLSQDITYGDQQKLLEVQLWGGITWKSMRNAFYGCENMQITASDIPNLTEVTQMNKMFSGCKAFNSNINNWDVSNVQIMTSLFSDCENFNQPLNNWNVGQVVRMRGMFNNCKAFNQPLDHWDVSNVTDMSYMLKDCQSFNQNLGSWDLSALKHESGFGHYASKSMEGMLDNCGMDCTNYTASLVGWEANANTPYDIVLGANGLTFGSDADEAHQKLLKINRWSINGDNYDENCSSAVAVTGVTLSPTTITLEEGESQLLQATVLPDDASNKDLMWSCDNTAIASVGSNGLVTGNAVGTATVMVTTLDGGFTATCLVTVTPASTPIEPVLDVNFDDYDFGLVNLGTTKVQTFVLTNIGNAPLNVSDIALSGNAAFIENGTANTIAIGSNYTFDVEFTPTAEGLVSATLTIANNTASPTVEVLLTGTGVMPGIEVNPTNHDFGEVEIGQTAVQAITITNPGTATLTISSITLSGDADFSHNGVAMDIPAGDSYTFDVEFTPTAEGLMSATLTLENNTITSTVEVSLMGTGVMPDIVLTPTSHDYGTVALNTTVGQTFTLTNNGSVDAEFENLTITGVDASFFDYQNDYFLSDVIIPAGGSITIDIEYTPTVAGTHIAVATFETSAGDFTANLTGMTLADNDGDGFTEDVDCNDNDASINPDAEDIPGDGIDQDCDGEDASLTLYAPTITVENMCGYSVLTASNYSGTLTWSTGESTESITVNTAGVYSVTQTVSETTSAAATTTVTIKPIPDAPIVTVDNQVGQSVLTAGNYSGDLLWSNGETSESITVNTVGIYSVTQTIDGCESPEGSGEANPMYPLFDITPTSHDFGEVEVSQDATQMFTITNNGTATLVITTFALNGDADFSHNGVNNTEVAPNGGTYTFSATFAPQIEGEQTATITITDNITRETHDVILTGNGKISPCDYWIGNCDICGCFDTTTGEPFELNVSVGTNGSVYCPEDNSGTWSVVAMPAGLTATPTFTDIHNYNTTFYAPIPGDYILRYTWGALYNNQYLEARYRIVEKPIISIHGDEVVNICKTNEYTLSDDREYNTESLTYSWSIEGGTISGSTTGESVEVQWDNQAGTATLTASAWYSDYDVCSRTVEFTVEKKNPTFAGQVKYWNQEETYMPSPYQTCDYCTNPHDYFYVTLLHNENRGFIELDTQKVQPRLTEDLMELMSYFEFDIDVAQYGCDAEFALRIWDGGLVYHDNLPAGQPTNTHLGANYTYKHFGSVNATDALAIQLMVGGANNINAAPYNYNWVGLNTDTPQYGFYSHSIADVNSSNPYANGGITALDALTVKYRSVGLIANYPDNGSDNEFGPNYRVAGRMVPELPYTTFPEPFDWDNVNDIDFRHSGAEYEYMSPATAHYYESQPFAWNSRDYSFINIYYNLVGDINSSYTPEGNISKRDSDVELAYEEAVSAQVGEEVTLPIRINHTEKLGAITLSMTYRNDLIEVLSTNYDKANGEYHIDAENGLLNIAWYDSYGKTFANDEAIAYITVKVLQPISENTELFSLASTTEFADVNAHKLEGIRLSTYNLNNSAMPENSTFSSMNYPNPFEQHTTIAYTLPESGEVNIAVYDLTGRLVKHLISEVQTAGTHTIEYSAPRGLNSGLLIYKITLNGNDGVKAITKKMSVSLVSNR